METTGKKEIEKGALFESQGRFFQSVRFPHMKKFRRVVGFSEDEVNKRMAEFIEYETNRKAEAKSRLLAKNEKERAERVEAAATVKVGDVFAYSWGYDQTNVEFFKITEVKGKMATLQAIGQKDVEGSHGFMSERVTAEPNVILIGKTWKKLIKGNAKQPYFSMGHGVATKDDGRGHYQSHYA